MRTVTDLFVKRNRGDEAMKRVSSLKLTRFGIEGAADALSTRQVLLLPKQTLAAFRLRPGELHENILLSGSDIHGVPSGAVVRAGTATLRLTFHCEPCKRIKGKVPLNKVIHKRGYLVFRA